MVGQHSQHKPNRLAAWGDSLLNKLQSRTRKRRKGHASKRRRAAERVDLARRSADQQ